VLLEEQLVCVLSDPRQPDRKVVAEPPQLIVPATSTKRQRQVSQVGVLFAQQVLDQVRDDLIFSARHRSNRSPNSENRPDWLALISLQARTPHYFADRTGRLSRRS
jgi:hypothetical protein